MRHSKTSVNWSFLKQLTTGKCDCAQGHKMVRFAKPLVTEIHVKEDDSFSEETKREMWYSEQDISDFRAKKRSSTDFDDLADEIQNCIEVFCWCIFDDEIDCRFEGKKKPAQYKRINSSNLHLERIPSNYKITEDGTNDSQVPVYSA